jgi:hypothetical protein
MNISRLTAALLVTALATFSSSAVNAVGTGQGGRDVLHVPLSWCGLTGSPAVSNPNIQSEGATTADTTTDAVLWRRHERPTDNILLPQADITLRSAINNAWGTLNFPTFADPDTGLGLAGDVRGEDNTVLGNGSEFAQVIQNCDNAWANLSRAGIGITAVNVKLFHDGSGDYIFLDNNGNPTGGTPIGWGGCVRPVGSNSCSSPYDGRIMVIDNRYLYPTVADRTLPPSPNEPSGNFSYSITDPFDQLVGHEVGHALGLNHAANTGDLMFSGQQDNNNDGRTDNINVNNTETTNLRQNGQTVPGLEIDPPARIDPGNFAAMTLVDIGQDNAKLPPHHNLTSVKMTLDKEKGLLYVSARVAGVTPADSDAASRLWLALDAVAEENSGNEFLRKMNFPFTDFAGADTFVVLTIKNGKVSGKAIRVRGGKSIKIHRPLFELRRLIMHPYYTRITGQRTPLRVAKRGVDIHDVITVALPAEEIGIALGRPFTAQLALTTEAGIDLMTGKKGKELRFILEDPHFPNCFAQSKGRPGESVAVEIERLLPDSPIHALFGPMEVAKTTTDENGNARIDLPIPVDAAPGLHLVTVGVDETAFTADCVIEVVKGDATGGGPCGPPAQDGDDKHRSLALQCQCRNIQYFGRLTEKAMAVDKKKGLRLIRDYRDLVRQHGLLTDKVLNRD